MQYAMGQQQVMSKLRESDALTMTVQDYIDHTGLHYSTCHRHLEELVEDGWLTRRKDIEDGHRVNRYTWHTSSVHPKGVLSSRIDLLKIYMRKGRHTVHELSDSSGLSVYTVGEVLRLGARRGEFATSKRGKTIYYTIAGEQERVPTVEESIIRMVKERGQVSREDIQVFLGRSQGVAHTLLTRLLDKGYLVRTRPKHRQKGGSTSYVYSLPKKSHEVVLDQRG